MTAATKEYSFKRLMEHYPIGQPPPQIQPSRVVVAMVDCERDGFAQKRLAKWKDDLKLGV